MDAVERIKQHFPVPSEPPREAWFMDPTKQGYYTGLLEAIAGDETDIRYIERYLFDTGGIKNFGRYKEWVVWFQCLLPHLFAHILKEGLLPLTINYFLNVYPGQIPDEYDGFRDDVLRTLPQVIMESEVWDGQDLSKKFWWYDEWEGYWTCPLYATMFFCLKYLTPAEISSWVASIAEIDAAFWREQIHKWLKGANEFFKYVEPLEKVSTVPSITNEPTVRNREEDSVAKYLEVAGINWHNSMLVFEGHYSSNNIWDYLSKENAETLWSEVKKYPELSFSDTPMN